jgi:flagellar motor switch protein FliN/FliY
MVEQSPKQQVHATPYNYKPLGGAERMAADLGIDDNNLELIMSVPIQITVELGKTKKKIKDIAELTVGNIVELNRQAGDQVDVVANGRLIAKGDVVVVDDNYSVRITEIIKAKETNFNEPK